MGNNESLPSERHTRRLSKTRLSGSDTTLSQTLSLTDLRASFERKYHLIGISELGTTNMSASGERRSSRRSREQLWSQLCDFDWDGSLEWETSGGGHEQFSSTAKGHLPDTPRPSFPFSQTQGTASMVNRMDSMTSNPPKSVPMKDGRLDLEATIAAIRELSKTAAPQDLIALHKALLPLDEPCPDKCSRGPEYSSSLIRKRSFARPGLATRTAGGVPAPKTSSVNSSASAFQPGRRKDASTHLSAVEAVIESNRPACLRAETPADMTFLGPYELGSLVVTNGTPSPEPITSKSDVASDRDFASDRGYYTASEGQRSSDDLPRRSLNSLDSITRQTFISLDNEVDRSLAESHRSRHIPALELENSDSGNMHISSKEEARHTQVECGRGYGGPARVGAHPDDYFSDLSGSHGESTREKDEKPTDTGESYPSQHSFQTGNYAHAAFYAKTNHFQADLAAATPNEMKVWDSCQRVFANDSRSVEFAQFSPSDKSTVGGETAVKQKEDSGYSSADSPRSLEWPSNSILESSRILGQHSSCSAEPTNLGVENCGKETGPFSFEADFPYSSPRGWLDQRGSCTHSGASTSHVLEHRQNSIAESSTRISGPGAFNLKLNCQSHLSPFPRKTSTSSFPMATQTHKSVAGTISEASKNVRANLSRRLSSTADTRHLERPSCGTFSSQSVESIESGNPEPGSALGARAIQNDRNSPRKTTLGDERRSSSAHLRRGRSQTQPQPPPRFGIDLSFNDMFSSWDEDIPSVSLRCPRPSTGFDPVEKVLSDTSGKPPSTPNPSRPSKNSVAKSGFGRFRKSSSRDPLAPRPQTAHGSSSDSAAAADQARKRDLDGAALAQRAIARRNSFYGGKTIRPGEMGVQQPPSFSRPGDGHREASSTICRPGLRKDSQGHLQFDEESVMVPQVPSLPSIREQVALAKAKLSAPAGKSDWRGRAAKQTDEPTLSVSTKTMLSKWEAQSSSESQTPARESKKGAVTQSRPWSQRTRGLGGHLLAKLKPGPLKIVPPTIVVSRYITPTTEEFPKEISRES